MCDILQIRGKPETIETVEGLFSLVKRIQFSDIYEKIPPGSACLCGVDLEATAQINGYECTFRPEKGEYIWEKV